MPKIRVMVVDDAVVMRKMISDVLNKDPQIEVVATASNGKIALQRIPQMNPDLITLDVEMPEMNGIETLREIRKIYPKLPVIMFSTLTARGAATTLDALTSGASDYVTKPANIGSISEGISRLSSELIPKIKAHCRHIKAVPDQKGEMTQFFAKVPRYSAVTRIESGKDPEILAIGTSTGGPNALADLFRGVQVPVRTPIVIVQHMPPMFTALLADRLNHVSGVRFCEGQDGQRILPGHAYIAPGGKHMTIRREMGHPTIRLNLDPPENSCRPAVDVLFRSVVECYGVSTLGVILTGMGQDGLRGCQLIREAGGQVIAQDEATSVVWGMPGCVAHANLAHAVLPLPQIWPEIQRRLQRSGQVRTTSKAA